MVIIANPIYDAVFKYLMEDERVAKLLLSALLKKEVRKLEMRRNEYCNQLQSGRISMFRLDFSALIADADGTERLVLIELQKTWLPTETLRFRQYLGSQYLSKENVLNEEEKKDYGLPIISIYILGHKVGNLQEPVVYVRRRYLDYDEQQITEGVPDPFIESLTHDSIIVQIPYLQGRTRNHLERLLTVFDQEFRLKENDHFLQFDETGVNEDNRLLVHRLIMAAASPELRREMQVEDEFLSEIEKRDTAILVRDQEILKNKQVIEQKDLELELKDLELEQKDQVIAQAIRNLIDRDMSPAEIAAVLSLQEEEVRKFC